MSFARKLNPGRSLGTRIIVYLLAMLIIFGVLMRYYVERNAEMRYNTDLDLYGKYGKSLVTKFTSDFLYALMTGDKEMIAKESEKVLEDEMVSYVVVYDERLEKLYESHKQESSYNIPPPLKGGARQQLVTREIKSGGGAFLDFQITVRSEGGEEGKALGVLRAGISLETLQRQLEQARVQGYALIGVVLVLGLVVVWLSLRSVLPPIRKMMQATQRISQGDFDVEIEVKSKDEIGVLAKTFNQMASDIKKQNENITDAVKLLTDTTSHLMSVTTQQTSGATEQATVVSEVVTTSQEISSTADRIADTASAVKESADKSSQAANSGNEYMVMTINSMENIRQHMEKAMNQILELSSQANRVGSIIDIIEEVSEQTNLLALNASIEAAGAGEAGSRFSVVATEVRRLANRTMETIESVRNIVDSIQTSTNSMVMLSENQHKAVESGVQSVRSMGEHFAQILEFVDSTSQFGTEISHITKQQSSATQQMASSINEVADAAKEVENGVKEIESSMDELNKLAKRLNALVISDEKDKFQGASY